MNIRGRVIFRLFGLEGEVLEERQVENLITDEGLGVMRDLLGGEAVRPDELAVGTDATAAAPGDVALVAEIARRAVDRRGETAAGVQFQALFELTEANGTLAEQGLFAVGRLVARSVLVPPIVKSSANRLTVQHEITVARG